MSRPSPRTSKSAAPVFVALLLLTAFAFSPLLVASFCNVDDVQNVLHNPYVNPPSLAGLKEIWGGRYLDLYVPVTYTFWAGLCCLGQPDAHVFHGSNIALHLASVVGSFFLLRRFVSGGAAVVGSAVFALHPLQVEAVGWLSGSKDLLCTLFSVLALWLYAARQLPRTVRRNSVAGDQADDEQHARRKSVLRYIAATISFSLALLGKPTAVVVPLVAFAVDVLILNVARRRSLRNLSPWFILAAATAVVARHVQPASTFASPPLSLRPAVAADALIFYVSKLFLPIHLSFVYGRAPASVLQNPTWAIAACVMTFVCLAVLGFALHRRSVVAVGGLMAVLFLLPVLGFVPFHYQRFSTTADHYMYPAMLGVAVAAAALFDRLSEKRKPVATGVVIVLAGVWAVLTFQQSRTWYDSGTIFEHALVATPDNAFALNNLAAFELDRQDAAAAETHARRAADVDPKSAQALTTLGAALAAQGKFDDAVEAGNRAAALGRDSAPALTNLSGLFGRRGDLDRAATLARQAVAADPDYPPAHLNLGTVLAQQNHPEEAATELRTALRLDPRDTAARLNLAALLMNTRQLESAKTELHALLSIDPANVAAAQMLRRLP